MPLRFGNPIKLLLELRGCGIGKTFERVVSEKLCWLLAEKGENSKKNTESFLSDKNGDISLN